MDTNPGFAYSWSGFVDYSSCYHTVRGFWIFAQSVVFFGTGLSMVPQIFRIVKFSSSHGISPIFVSITTVAQVTIVLNMFSLHNADFTGVMQVAAKYTVPRFLSFCVAFILWFAYLPVLYLISIFFDRIPRIVPPRSDSTIAREWQVTTTLMCLVTGIEILVLIPYIGIGTYYGYASSELRAFGEISGIVSSAISIVQYLPQFITVCKLKDNGSFSLVTLGIQAPGGTLSTISMMVGQNEHWSTWLSLGVSALQQWILLFLCISYKWKSWCQERIDGLTSVDSFAQDADIDNRSLLRSSDVSHFSYG
jgi:uncharacterized protein with PQ loop repeat